MELPIAAAWHALGKLHCEQALAATHAALNRGCDSDSLVQVLCVEPRWPEVAPVFERALGELGVPIPSPGEAVQVLARDYARCILAGELSPHDGARAIWFELSMEPVAGDSLNTFVGLASEWEDYPPLRAKYEADILKAARELVGETRTNGNTGGNQ